MLCHSFWTVEWIHKYTAWMYPFNLMLSFMAASWSEISKLVIETSKVSFESTINEEWPLRFIWQIVHNYFLCFYPKWCMCGQISMAKPWQLSEKTIILSVLTEERVLGSRTVSDSSGGWSDIRVTWPCWHIPWSRRRI